MAPQGPVFAHSLPHRPQTDWEQLDDHHAHVARRTTTHAAAFAAAAWGACLGLWHDLGKRHPDFQRYIRGERADGPPHAWAGAMLAATRGAAGTLAAFAIAGHHAGLSDLRADPTAATAPGPTPLTELMNDPQLKATLAQLRPLFAPAEVNAATPSLPPHLAAHPSAPDLFTRFLFSALVDADRLATADFYARFTPSLTATDLQYDDIPTLRARLDAKVDAMPPKGSPAVVELRRQVLHACRTKASDPPGRYSLTVPTGGGKTLSAMSFALNHAATHNLRRVIVVISFTSIALVASRRSFRLPKRNPYINRTCQSHTPLTSKLLDPLRCSHVRTQERRRRATRCPHGLRPRGCSNQSPSSPTAPRGFARRRSRFADGSVIQAVGFIFNDTPRITAAP